MIYNLRVSSRFRKEFKKLDKYTQRMMKVWIEKNLKNCKNPIALGKALTANHKGQWCYCMGDYRLICGIRDKELIILALTIGHRN